MKKSKSSAGILPQVTPKFVFPERKYYLPNPTKFKPSRFTFTTAAVDPASFHKLEPSANTVCAYRHTMSHAKQPLACPSLRVPPTPSGQQIFREQL